jgi:hypothetical protein
MMTHLINLALRVFAMTITGAGGFVGSPQP